MMTVYEVMVEWSCNHERGLYTEIYSTKRAAIEAMGDEIALAKLDYEAAFDDAGNLDEDWTLEESADHWELYQSDWWDRNHCEIKITEKDVKGDNNGNG